VPNTYRLTKFLRGQHGSDAKMPDEWHVGSRVVLLDQLPDQVTIPTAARGQPRHYRYGPASRPLGDPTYRYEVQSFQGEGWRPYRVAHLKAKRTNADLKVSWIRRTRVEGDLWKDTEVPLGEAEERYHIEVRQAGDVVRTQTTTSEDWIYQAADQSSELGAGSFEIAVAQTSDRYGIGPFQIVTLTN